jgi:MFS family permease
MLELARRSRPVAVLRRPGIARLFALSVIGRTPTGAIGLLLILRVRELDGGYELGGLVVAGFMLGVATCAPFVGRAIDALGQTPVLLVTATASGLGLAAAAALPADAPPAALVPIALAIGAAHPPIESCMRVLLGRLLADPDERHAALSLEASLQEISFTLGPLVFVALVGAHSAAGGLAACAAVAFGASALFAATRESRQMPGGSARRRVPGAPLRRRGIRTLLVAIAGLGAMFGANEVALVASAGDAGHPSAVGILLGIYCLTSLVAGVVTAHRKAPASPARELTALFAAAAVGHALLAAAPSLLALGLLVGVAGAVAAPIFALLYALTGELAPEGTVTETYTWLGSSLFGGAALGAAVGGGLIEGAGTWAAFVAAGAAAAVVACVVRTRASTLVTPRRRGAHIQTELKEGRA